MKFYNYIPRYLKSALLTFIFFFTTSTLWAQLPCGQNIDLNTWNVEGQPASGQWDVNTGGSSVNQTVNGTATWFVSPDDYFNVLIQGTITVNTAADDDLVGFVFGYQNPIGTITNPSNTYMKTFICDWKQTTQNFVGLTSNEGFALYEKDGAFDFTDVLSQGTGQVYPELWTRTNNPTINVLDTDYSPGSGWNDNQTYDFQLKYTADSIVIWIDSVRIFEESGCFEPGRFGFYNHSQSDVTYSDFSYKHEYDFSVVDPVICVGDTGQFVIGAGCNNTIPSYIDFEWDFGDGSTGTGIDPDHQYLVPGTYTVEMIFTDNNGCIDTAEQTITVLPYPTPDAGQDVTACSLTHTLNATATANSGVWTAPPGTIINNPNSPNSTVSVSAPGTYTFIWTESNSEGCEASDEVTITFEVVDVSVSGGILDICVNDSVTLTADGAQSYTWSPSIGLNTTSGPVVIASPPFTQTYTVVGSNANGCFDSASITVNVDTTCCDQATDPSFQAISTYISTDTYLDGKYYVPDNTIIIVDAALLDITNVDIVFGQCAGIDFINGANIRANNSVLRPCNLNDTWRGVRFVEPGDEMNQVNESTFKNAEIALLFEERAEAQINSNTFSNCNEGITLDKTIFTETIFGNNFITNSSFPQFTNCYETTDPDDVIHIHSPGSSDFNELANEMVINQNSFAMSHTGGTITTTAIDLLNSQASISENTMTNMQFAIVIDDPRGGTFIEGNEIENNSQFQATGFSMSQISLFNSNGVAVRIDNNELTNSAIGGPFVSTAIQLSRSNNVSISNNYLEGFDSGISGRVVTDFNISENTMNSIRRTGIRMDEAYLQGTNFITCNDITMIMNSGISVYVSRCSEQTEISSNCLKDGVEGIRTLGFENIPLIRNNFIYNYRRGIRNFNHTGNIGTSTDPGMNTLWSNDNNSIDIISNSPISVGNNFGMFNITFGTVSITANNPIHSTASCGHQIFNMPSQGSLNTNYTCDNLDEFVQPMLNINGNNVLPNVNNVIEYLSGKSNEAKVIARLIQLDGFDQAYLQELINATNMSAEDEAFVRYSFFKHNNEFDNASLALAELNATSYGTFAQIEKLVLKRLMGQTLDANDFASIDAYLQDTELETSLYNLAVSLSKTGPSHGIYKSEIEHLDFDQDFGPTARVQEETTSLEIFPNPTTDEINIQILEGQMIEGQRLLIYDMYGNVVKMTSLDFVSGIEKVNVSSLASGTYFVVLVSDESRSERTKFTKL